MLAYTQTFAGVLGKKASYENKQRQYNTLSQHLPSTRQKELCVICPFVTKAHRMRCIIAVEHFKFTNTQVQPN